MAYNYDDLYATTPDALGEPTNVFVDFFARHDGDALRVLDVGCGQGRDALFIARLGHSVVGLDLSLNGICDLLAVADRDALAITGFAADITTYTPEGRFDVILCDRTLHMLDKAAQRDVLTRYFQHVRPKGWVLIADERGNMQGFKDVFVADAHTWQITLEKGGTLFVQRS